jgi:hypothetical protein
MAMDGGKPPAITGTTTDWPLPPEPDFLILPLNLRSQLARFGISGDDLIVIDGMPEDAALTAGAKKPDGSWSLREIDLDACSFMPLYGNGETYTLRACVLTPDSSDHGLPKTKGKAEIKVEVPLTPLPILEAFDDALPAPAPIPAPDTVIQLPADPKLKATAPIAAPASLAPAATHAAPSPAPAAPVASKPAPAQATPQSNASPAQPAALPKPEASRGTFDQQLAKLRAEWQAKVARQVAAAEERLKATHLAQLGRIQGTAQDDSPRSATIDSKGKTEPTGGAAASVAQPPRGDAATAEARAGEARAEERLASARTQWQVEHEAALAQARETWRSEEAARLAAAEAAWRAEALQQRTAVEARMEESYKERMAGVEAALAAAEAAWRDEALQERTVLEARIEESYKERLAVAEAALAAKASVAPPATQDWSVKLEHALADAQVGWEADEADRRARLEADMTAAHDRRIAEIETQQAALYEMRLAAAEAAWQKAEAERLAAAEIAWSAGEAERLAAMETKWRAEHDKKLEAVLANLGTMMKGQLGSVGNASLLPAIEPAPPVTLAPQPQPGDAQPADRNSDDLGWRETAAA